MRNIYEIIAEQKALVDINIAIYDLNHASNYLIESSEEYYIEEGLGEGIKNAAAKVVEFIKNIIRKISELIKRVKNWLLGKKDTEAKLNKKIQDINEGKSTDSEADGKKDEEDWKNLSREEILKRRKARKEKEKREKNAGKPITIGGETPQEKKEREMKKQQSEKERRKNANAAYAKLNDIESVMKACKGQVRMKVFRDLVDQINIGGRFFAAVPGAIDGIDKGRSSFDVEGDVIEKTFKRRNEFTGAHSKSVEEHIKEELFGDDDYEIEGYISSFADKVLYYIRNSDTVIKSLEKQEQKAKDTLNKLLHEAQVLDDMKKLSNVQQFASFVGKFVESLVSSITKSRSAADDIANKAIVMYRDQIRRGQLPK